MSISEIKFTVDKSEAHAIFYLLFSTVRATYIDSYIAHVNKPLFYSSRKGYVTAGF